MIKLNGTKLAKQVENKLKVENQEIFLNIIQIGNDYSSSVYIKKKFLICDQLNIKKKLWHFKQAKEKTILKLIEKLNNDSKVNGILVQLPIPNYLNTKKILNQISPLKDVDIFRNETLKLQTSDNQKPMPCVVGAIFELIKKYKIPIENKNILIIGKGKSGGEPIIKWFKKNKIKFEAVDKKSKLINEKISMADILISAIGKKNVIDSLKIRKGCAFFDVGISHDKITKKVTGDIDYDVAKKIAKWGTPVPGGIGPLTIIMLIKNLIILKKIQDEKNKDNNYL